MVSDVRTTSYLVWHLNSIGSAPAVRSGAHLSRLTCDHRISAGGKNVCLTAEKVSKRNSYCWWQSLNDRWETVPMMQEAAEHCAWQKCIASSVLYFKMYSDPRPTIIITSGVSQHHIDVDNFYHKWPTLWSVELPSCFRRLCINWISTFKWFLHSFQFFLLQPLTGEKNLHVYVR